MMLMQCITELQTYKGAELARPQPLYTIGISFMELTNPGYNFVAIN